jgi:hypothetical protein
LKSGNGDCFFRAGRVKARVVLSVVSLILPQPAGNLVPGNGAFGYNRAFAVIAGKAYELGDFRAGFGVPEPETTCCATYRLKNH